MKSIEHKKDYRLIIASKVFFLGLSWIIIVCNFISPITFIISLIIFTLALTPEFIKYYHLSEKTFEMYTSLFGIVLCAIFGLLCFLVIIKTLDIIQMNDAYLIRTNSSSMMFKSLEIKLSTVARFSILLPSLSILEFFYI